VLGVLEMGDLAHAAAARVVNADPGADIAGAAGAQFADVAALAE
jgi:hypothetical protein